ncbi:hypothetical protein [Nocardioides stalactiti]|uniref:hypothetical protein n=1 Tax=Nocardioides stalactiti TaxID=2755356 RepID=UPI00160240F2|nr:hypothetical protein [Nocardioides stalactiti]
MKVRWLVLAAVLAPVAFATAAGPARAADDPIALSADGVTWGHALSSPLFTRDHVWVPGDVQTRSFYVRNDGPTGARLTVALQAGDSDRLLSDRDLALSARAATGPWTRVRNGGDVAPLVRDALEQGESVRVDLRASFRWRSTNESMVDQVPLQVVVVLRQDGHLTDDETDVTLPGVGSTVPWWLLTVAVCCLLGGVTIVLISRHREERHE